MLILKLGVKDNSENDFNTEEDAEEDEKTSFHLLHNIYY